MAVNKNTSTGTSSSTFEIGKSQSVHFRTNAGITQYQDSGDVFRNIPVFGMDFTAFTSNSLVSATATLTKINSSFIPSFTTKPYVVYWSCEIATGPKKKATIANINVIINGVQISGIGASFPQHSPDNTTGYFQTYSGHYSFATLSNPSTVVMKITRASGNSSINIRNAQVYIWRES